jgi:hypothetical protein
VCDSVRRWSAVAVSAVPWPAPTKTNEFLVARNDSASGVVGPSGPTPASTPTSAAAAPWPAPTEGGVRGPLGMGDGVLSVFIRDSGVTFPVLTPEEKVAAEAQAQWEAGVEAYDEEYWRLFRETAEHVRQSRTSHGAAQLVMSADEITAYYQRVTQIPRSEEEREFDIKVVLRLKPGPEPGRNVDPDLKYLAFWRECINAKKGNIGRAKIKFLKDGQRKPPHGLGAKLGTLKNALYRLKLAPAK